MAEVTEINHVESTATRFALNTHEVANLPVCVCVCVLQYLVPISARCFV